MGYVFLWINYSNTKPCLMLKLIHGSRTKMKKRKKRLFSRQTWILSYGRKITELNKIVCSVSQYWEVPNPGQFLWKENGIIFRFFNVLYSTLFLLLPLRIHCVGGWWDPVPEIIDTVFAKTSPKRCFLWLNTSVFGLFSRKRGSINSGSGLLRLWHWQPDALTKKKKPK